MDAITDSIRYTTTFFAAVTAVAMFTALKGSFFRLVPAWLAVAFGAGMYFSHVRGSVPHPALVPAGALLGLGIGIAALFSRDAEARFNALDDMQWRSLTLLRAVFGALLLGAAACGIMPAAFALPAGLGNLAAAAFAVIAPGSLAAGGHRPSRAFVFGFGMLDFAVVLTLMVKVLVPWLIETHSIGISVLLPWVALPLLLMLNLFGLRGLLKEMTWSSRVST